MLDKPGSAKGFNNLLDDDKDKYGISPCSDKVGSDRPIRGYRSDIRSDSELREVRRYA